VLQKSSLAGALKGYTATTSNLIFKTLKMQNLKLCEVQFQQTQLRTSDLTHASVLFYDICRTGTTMPSSVRQRRRGALTAQQRRFVVLCDIAGLVGAHHRGHKLHHNEYHISIVDHIINPRRVEMETTVRACRNALSGEV